MKRYDIHYTHKSKTAVYGVVYTTNEITGGTFPVLHFQITPEEEKFQSAPDNDLVLRSLQRLKQHISSIAQNQFGKDFIYA